jgi:hypothetical protein
MRKMQDFQTNRTNNPKPGYKLKVLDTWNQETTVYSSLREAARPLDMSVGLISRRLKLKITKPYKKKKKKKKKRYIISADD